jgi:hypothetical protein
MSRLARSIDGYVINAFPLRYGKTMLTSGTHTDVTAVYCQADGDLSILYPDSATPETVTMAAGEVFTVQDATSVEISTGTFHLM